LEKIADDIRQKYNEQQQLIEQQRTAVRQKRQQLSELQAKLHKIDVDVTRFEQQSRQIREKMWETYEVDFEQQDLQIPQIDQDDAEVCENISVLKERIKRVGQVNMAALEDYEIESKRLEDLTTQRDDLQKAVDDLQKAIKKLDNEARTQFVETFEKVRKNFKEMFTTLFDGGEAQLELQQDVDPLEAAIRINVRPAGKKMRGVQLLSGGERALTAIALLFGLYQVKPSAYCILDELDAPLDDANVDRFIKILRKFTEHTQFIVITHNKRTMECSDRLYGVTQQVKGISTIVSVSFEEAELQAA